MGSCNQSTYDPGLSCRRRIDGLHIEVWLVRDQASQKAFDLCLYLPLPLIKSTVVCRT
ncbi:hypothetical protein D3C80_935320 [compost metagenome]